MATASNDQTPAVCSSCGLPVAATANVCGVCGRARVRPQRAEERVPVYAGVPSAAAVAAAEAPTLPSVEPPTSALPTQGYTWHPPQPSWQQAPPQPVGITSLAPTEAAPHQAPLRSTRRRTLLTALTIVVLIALLGGGTYWVYAFLAARSDTVAARYLPATTVAMASIDLVAFSSNNHQVSATDLTKNPALTQELRKTVGLDLQQDVLPWLGRTVTVAVFTGGSGTSGVGPQLGLVVLLASRDDGAAQAALKKLAAYQRSRGNSVTESSYSGFALYDEPATATTSTVAFAAGKGWAVLGSDAAAVKQVLDRLDGRGETLATSPAFRDATSDLPSDRFGTVYFNVRQLVNGSLPSTGGLQAPGVQLPFLDAYPAAAGSLAWSSQGARQIVTFKATKSLGVPQLSGDTTSLAGMVPAESPVYTSVANVGQTFSTVLSLVGPMAANVDPVASALGIPATAPELRAQGALALVPRTGNTAGPSGTVPAFYLRVSDQATAQSLLATSAKAKGWTLRPATVAGQSATAIYATDAFPGPLPPGTTKTARTLAPATTGAETLVATAFYLRSTLIIVGPGADLARVVSAAQGGSGTLATTSAFTAAVAQQSGAHVSLTYVDIARLLPSGSGQVPTLGNLRPTGLLLTTDWTDQLLRMTTDIALAK